MNDLKKLELPSQGLNTLFGVQDQNIKYLESLLDVNIGARGNELLIDGDERDIKTVEQILRDFGELFDEGNLLPTKSCATPSNRSRRTAPIALRTIF